MNFSYTEYYEDEPEKIKLDAKGQEKPYKDPVEIVIRITMEKSTYEKRKTKYKEPIWVKAKSLFEPKYKK